MKLSELMASYTPNADFEGFVTNDDFVLAIDCSADGSATVKDYAVAQLGVTGLDANLNPITQDKTYIRAGQSTMKTGNQRAFKVSGDRYIGDDFQDFALSHAVMYGTGSAVIRKYVYFCLLNGKGETGQASIIAAAPQVRAPASTSTSRRPTPRPPSTPTLRCNLRRRI